MKILTNKEYKRRIGNAVNKALEDEYQNRRMERLDSRIYELEKRIRPLEERKEN